MEDFRKSIDQLRALFQENSSEETFLEKYLESIGSDENILIKAAEWGTKDDISFLLGIEGLEVNKKNSRKESAADILWKKERYEELVIALQKDSRFPNEFKIENVNKEKSHAKGLIEFVEGRRELHNRIKQGDLVFIKNYTEKNGSSIYYREGNISALSQALDNDKKEIYTYFASIRPKFSIPINDLQPERPSKVLQKSHFLKLVDSTKFLELDREYWEAVIDMYLELEKHQEVRCLMKAIRSEEFEIWFDNTEHTLTKDGVEAYGWTKQNVITIAAREVVTRDGRNHVFRVFAHEICHLAMFLVYRNVFYPFPQNDEERRSMYWNICESLEKNKSKLDHYIQRVYEREERHWMVELIVRIPEIVAFYGKEKSATIFEQQIPSLFHYYNDYIVPDCKKFSEIGTHSDLKEIKGISKDHLGIHESDIDCSPFSETENYKKHLIPWEINGKSISIFPTKNLTLGALHIFHQFKVSHPFHSDKIFLAIPLENYYKNKNHEIIRKVFESPVFKMLVLIVTKKYHDSKKDIFRDVEFGSGDGKEVILLVPNELSEKEWKHKCITYHWTNLTEKFQNKLMGKTVSNQGKSATLEDLLEDIDITSELLTEMTDQQNLSVGEDWSSMGNTDKLKLYIERSFLQYKFKKENFSAQALPQHHLFITGIGEREIKKMTREDWVQSVKSGDEIKLDSYVFLPELNEEFAMLFRKISSVFGEEDSVPVLWLHFDSNDFLVREINDHEDEKSPLNDSSSAQDPKLEEMLNETKFGEKEMIRRTKKRRIVLVADDAGTGKSTSARPMMNKIKEQDPENFVMKVYFEDLVKEYPHASVRESNKNWTFLMRVCKISTRFEKLLFHSLLNQHGRVVLFVDGYDEICQDLRAKGLEILKLLSNGTKIQLWVLTRRAERLPLELETNAVSFSLTNFSEDDQLKYLNEFWKRKIKDLYLTRDFATKFDEMVENVGKYAKECGSLHSGMQEVSKLFENDDEEEIGKKISELDFRGFCKKAIIIVREEVLKVKSIPPLWLWMMANIITDRSLQIPVRKDLFDFYLHFSEIKVDLFLREKCELKLEKECQKRLYKLSKKRVVENLLAYSDELFGSLLFKAGQVNDEDLEELVDIGLVKKVGRSHRFIHKTFWDFFFAQAIINSQKLGKQINVDELFLEKLLCPKYNEYLGVQNFLCYFIMQNKNRKSVFPKHLFEGSQLSNAFLQCCPVSHELAHINIILWRRVILDSEEVSDEYEPRNLFKKIEEVIKHHEDPEFIDQVFLLTLKIFGNKFLDKLFNNREPEVSYALSVSLQEEM